MTFFDWFFGSLEILWLAGGVFLIGTGEIGNILLGVLAIVCSILVLISIGVSVRGYDRPGEFKKTRFEDGKPVHED
jgi:hypothetical protein